MGFSTSIVGSLVAPVEKLDSIRQAQAINLKRDYVRLVTGIGGIVFDNFKLHADRVDFPLGWTLAGPTMKAMDDQIDEMAQDRESDLNKALSLAANR